MRSTTAASLVKQSREKILDVHGDAIDDTLSAYAELDIAKAVLDLALQGFVHLGPVGSLPHRVRRERPNAGSLPRSDSNLRDCR